MKRITYRMIALCLLLNLVGCAHKETENETVPYLTAPSNEAYSKIHADWAVYDSTEKLIEASTDIFSGELTDISFDMIDIKTGKSCRADDQDRENRMLHTIYTVNVSKVYKGESDSVRKICVIGGLPGVKEQEQLQVLKAFDPSDQSPVIPMLDSNRKLKIGETYLFCTSRTDGDFDNIVNISQFVFYTTSDTAKQIQNQCVASRQSLSIGMTFSEVSGLKGDYISFHYYVFHLNSDGHTIQIGEFGKDSGRVETITEFPAPEATPEAFTQITEGMPVTEVLRLVGVPSGSATFGIDSLDFKSTAGTVFRIIWDQNQRVAEIINIS